MQLDDLHLGASVVSRDGHKLGTLSRFVVDKDSLKLTHVVVDTGLLRSGESLWKGGWGLSHDRVVPLGALVEADSDEVKLSMSGDEFKDHSVDYIQERFDAMGDMRPGRPDASDLRRLSASIPGEPGPFVVTELMSKSPSEVDIKRDSPVWRLNPHEKVGEVERAIFDEDTQQVRALVVRRGFVFTKDVVLPMRYAVEVVGDIVRVEMDDAALERLEEFRAED